MLMVLVISLAVLANNAFAQPGRGGPGGFGGGGALGLLQNASVRKELELLDDQIAEIGKAAEASSARARELFANGDFRNLSEEERSAKFAELREATQKEVDKILLPHQSERLKQIEFQISINRGGRGGVFSVNDELAEALDISDEQREKIGETAEQVAEELRAKLRELQEEARAKILATLTPAQQAKYKQLVGEPFEYVAEQPNFGGRGGEGGRDGGRGRPGGDGGRGRPGGEGGRGRPAGDN
jgi:Spy/CpxP family protein refolding chaperone